MITSLLSIIERMLSIWDITMYTPINPPELSCNEWKYILHIRELNNGKALLAGRTVEILQYPALS